MIWPSKKEKETSVGIDIGTSAVRIVEVSRHGEQAKLENYGELSIPLDLPLYFGQTHRGRLLFSSKRLAEMISERRQKAGIEKRSAFFSIPDFSTLLTTFELPPMKLEEVSKAVQFEARNRVPLPISEVTLDWMVMEGGLTERSKEPVKIMLVVVPNRVIEKYTEIAQLCGLELKGMEVEVFSLQRSLIKDDKKTVALIDIGAQSTTCNIVDRGVLKRSRSFSIAGTNLTERISEAFEIEYQKAETIKENQGLKEGNYNLSEILIPVLDLILTEIKESSDDFYHESGRQVEKYQVAGGTAALPGLEEYFTESLKKEVEVGFPFKGMVYPSILKKELKRIGPAFVVATGVALKGIR